jgi:hypothetical protein
MYIDHASASDEFVRERYAVHAIPIVDTKGCPICQYTKNVAGKIIHTIWNCNGITLKLSICTAGQMR